MDNICVNLQMNKNEAENAAIFGVLANLDHKVLQIKDKTVIIEINRRKYTLLKHDSIVIKDISGEVILGFGVESISSDTVYYIVYRFFGIEINAKIRQQAVPKPLNLPKILF